MHPESAGRLADGTPSETFRQALERVLESRLFCQAPRLSRLLRYLGQHALAGSQAPLKESDVAVAVFDKPGDFDAAVDPIVRVEAGRLRQRLKRYYRNDGRNEAVRIRLPKGGYRLRFELRSPLSGTAPQPARARTRSGVCRVVILPFTDLTGDREHTFLAEGLVDDLIGTLMRDPTLRVLARRSSRHYARRSVNLQGLARELGADFVLEGSVRRFDARLRVCVHMADTNEAAYLWSEIFDFAEDDVALMGNIVGQAVASAVARHRRGSPKKHASRTRQTEGEVYLLTLKGRYHVRRRSRASLLKGVHHLELALARDPESAPALAALSEACTMLAWYGFLSPAETMPRAGRHAQRAVKLEPLSAHAHLALGLVQELYERDFVSAERQFRKACELDPADAAPWFELALCAARRGKTAAALDRMRRAVQLDPLSSTVRTNLGVCLYYQRRWQEAVHSLLDALELNEDYFPAHFRLGAVYLQLGRTEAAIASLRRALTLCEHCPTISGLLGYALAAVGKNDEALELAEQIASPDALCYSRPAAIAMIYLGLREKARALSLLEQAFLESDLLLVDLRADPVFDPLREEDAFRELVVKLRLAP